MRRLPRPSMAAPAISTRRPGTGTPLPSTGSATFCACGRPAASPCRPRSAAFIADRESPDEKPVGPWAGGLPFILRFDYGYDAVMRSYEDSLQRLGLPRVDLLVIHDIDIQYHGDDAGIEECFRQLDDGGGLTALEELKSAGDIEGYGAGINEGPMITRFLDRFALDFFLVAMPYTLVDQAPAGRGVPALCGERGSASSSARLTRRAFSPRGRSRERNTTTRRRRRRFWRRCAESRLCAAATMFPCRQRRCNSRSATRASRRSSPAPCRQTTVAQNLAFFRTKVPADLWAELKAEGLLRTDAPVPG